MAVSFHRRNIPLAIGRKGLRVAKPAAQSFGVGRNEKGQDARALVSCPSAIRLIHVQIHIFLRADRPAEVGVHTVLL